MSSRKVEQIILYIKYKYNLKNETEVAEFLGISRQTLYNYKHTGRIPEKLLISKNVNLDVKYPSGGYVAEAEDRHLPVIGLARAGPGLFTDPDFRDPEETASCPAGLHDPKAFWVPVIGNSMFPFLRPYSRVCVSPNLEAKNNDRVVVGLNDGQVMIAEIHHSKNHVILKKYNADDLKISKSELMFCYPIVHIREPK